MARNQTAITWQALTAQYTDSAFVALVSLAAYSEVDAKHYCYYLTNNSTTYTSLAEDGVNEHDYLPFPMAITMPSDEMGGISKGTFTATNVDRDLIDQIRSVDVPMIFNLTIVNNLDPSDIAVARFHGYTWRGLSYDLNNISGNITTENFVSEPYPGDLFTPAITPGLFI